MNPIIAVLLIIPPAAAFIGTLIGMFFGIRWMLGDTESLGERVFGWSMAFLIFALAMLMVWLLTFPIYGYALYSKQSETTLTVKGKERVGGDSGQYLVYSTTGKTYKISDTFYGWNFRASDRYGEITPGKTYTCTRSGIRVGFLSEYPNLLDCKEVGS